MTLETFLFACGGLIVGFVLRHFFTSYVSEKGKNAATKEDIEDITAKVESIKTQLSEQASFRQLRREHQAESLLAFHDAAVEILHEHYSVNFGDFPMDDGSSLFVFQTSFNEGAGKLVKAYRRLSVFLNGNETLLAPAGAVVAASVEAQKVFKKRFPAVKRAMIEEGMAYRLPSPDKSAFRVATDASDSANAVFWQAMKPHTSEFNNNFNVFVAHFSEFVAAPA